MTETKSDRKDTEDVPTRLAELNTVWLTRALTDVSDEIVVDFTCTPIDAGFYGSLARIDVEYAHRTPARKSFVAKFASEDRSVREALRSLGVYEREYNFYTRLASEIPTRIPECHFAYFDSKDQDLFLLLEWLDGTVYDDLTDISYEHARCAFTVAANIHTHWLEHSVLDSPWIHPFGAPPVLDGLVASVTSSLDKGMDLIGDYFPEWALANAPKAPQIIHRHLSALNTLPHTLVHVDYRLSNMVFTSNGSGIEMALIDWQSVLRAPGVCDIAFFSFMSLPVQDRRKWEQDLVSEYLRITEGWSRSTWPEWFEKAWCDMSLVSVFNCIRNATVLDLNNATTRDTMAAWIERACAAAEDHDALKYLPE